MRRTAARLAIGVALFLLAPGRGPLADRVAGAATVVPPDAVAFTTSAGPTSAGTTSAGTTDGGSNPPVVVAPGDSATEGLTVENRTPDLRLTVKVEVREPAGHASAASGDDPVSWITVVDSEVSLEPGAKAPAPLNVTVPYDALPGNRAVEVAAQVVAAQDASSNEPVEGAATATTPVTITVTDASGAQVSILDARPDVINGEPLLLVRMRNIGDSPASVAGIVDVSKPEPQHLSFRSVVDARKDYTERIRWKPPPKQSGAVVTVDVSYGNGDTATWSAPVDRIKQTTPTSAAARAADPARSESGHRGIGRFLLPALALLVALAAGAWLVFELRRGRRNAVRMPARAVAMPEAVMLSLIDRVEALTHKVDGLVTRPVVAASAPVAPMPAPAPTPVPTPVPVPESIFEPAPPQAIEPEPEPDPAPQPEPDHDRIDSSWGYPFDWPTEEDLARFEAERRARDDG